MEKLIREYKVSIRKLRAAKVKPIECSSMIDDAEYAIKYMETGNIPGTKWTVARWPAAKRDIPVDPMTMASIVRNRAPVVEAPKWVSEFLEKLMLTLTEREKDAFQLVRGYGYSFAQAGKLLKRSKSQVQMHVRRAEIKIQKAVRQKAAEKEEMLL